MRYLLLCIALFSWTACDPDDPCPGATLCDGVCVDTGIDPSNCGSCGSVCADDLVCQEGGCNLSCTGGTTDCGGSCLNLSNDDDHCGACDNACDDGLSCVDGACSLICVGGTTACGNACINLQVNSANCGACDTPCAAGAICLGGECSVQCLGGETECNSMCVDVLTDNDHCGVCGNECADGQVCSDGSCGANCQQPTADCDGQCLDLQTDTANCGACGASCAPGQGCIAGQCSDPEAFILPILDQGWHATFNDGHVAEDETLALTAAFAPNQGYAPGFMVIDTTNLPEVVVSASLRLLMTQWSEFNDEWEVIQVYDVSTPVATLTATGSNEAVVEDLSTGVLYGAALLNADLIGPSPFEFALNGAGLDALRNSTETFAIGLQWATPSEGTIEGAQFATHAGRNSLLVMGFNP